MNNLNIASNFPRPRSSILEIAPYKPGLERALGGVRQFKLSSNESPLGTSEKAKDVYLEMAGRLDQYPDGSATSLRKNYWRSSWIESESYYLWCWFR